MVLSSYFDIAVGTLLAHGPRRDQQGGTANQGYAEVPSRDDFLGLGAFVP